MSAWLGAAGDFLLAALVTVAAAVCVVDLTIVWQRRVRTWLRGRTWWWHVHNWVWMWGKRWVYEGQWDWTTIPLRLRFPDGHETDIRDACAFRTKSGNIELRIQTCLIVDDVGALTLVWDPANRPAKD